jgi:hypothetical protein
MTRKLATTAIALWAISALVVGVMFVLGNGHKGTDGRTVIRLAPDERDFVLSEMRGMLIAVQDISAALAKAAPESAAEAARQAGSNSVGGVPVSLMAKLPLEFKQNGMAMHGSFDDFANAANRGESELLLTGRLSNLLGNCVACHQAYRIDPIQ